MANSFARLINQYKLKYQRVFSAILDEQYEDDQVTNEIEFHINLKINQIITESEIDNIDIRSQLEPQIQNQETKDSGWKIDKITSMIFFYKTNELIGPIYIKTPLRFPAVLNIQNEDKLCFL